MPALLASAATATKAISPTSQSVCQSAKGRYRMTMTTKTTMSDAADDGLIAIIDDTEAQVDEEGKR